MCGGTTMPGETTMHFENLMGRIRLRRSRGIGLIGCVVVLGFVVVQWCPAEQVKPNIVLIMADDLGYGDLSCYGNEKFATPHLDRMAGEGMRFTNFYASGPVCSPTRAGLMTGRYQHRAGIPGVVFAAFDRNRHHGIHDAELTLAEVLREVGYATGIFGKWHLGYAPSFNPMNHGFDQFIGYVSGNVDFQNHIDGVGVFDWWQGRGLKDEPGYTTHLITRHAVEFIKAHRDEAFFCYIPHEAPHYPFQGPDDPAFRIRGQVVKEVRTQEHKRRAYREMIQELDAGIGEVLKTLSDLGLAEQTLVFFCSDNGATSAGSNGPLSGFKTQLWEGGIREPAIAWWPGTIEAGSTTDQVSWTIDMMPTIVDLAGAAEVLPGDRALDGHSLTGTLKGAKTTTSRTLFWEYGGYKAVRDGDWKLLVTPKQQETKRNRREQASDQVRDQVRDRVLEAESPADGLDDNIHLFYLQHDIGERTNLAATDRRRVNKMLRQWRDWYSEVNRHPSSQPSEPIKNPFQ